MGIVNWRFVVSSSITSRLSGVITGICFLVLAFLVYKEHVVGTVGSVILVAGCIIVDGWGFFIQGNTTYWPGLVIAPIGITYFVIRFIAQKEIGEVSPNP